MKSRNDILAQKAAAEKALLREQKLAAEKELMKEKILNSKAEQEIRIKILEESNEKFEFLKFNTGQKNAAKRESVLEDMFIKNRIPDIEYPIKIRDHISRIIFNYENYKRDRIAYYLKSRERSILTHDENCEDLRRQILREAREPLNKMFLKVFNSLLKVYCKVENAFKTEQQINEKQQFLLREIQNDLQEILWKIIDDFTFDNIENIDLEMEDMDRLNSYVFYQTKIFKILLWTLKCIPIPQNFNPRRVVKLEQLGVDLQISTSLDMEKITLQYLWFQHDYLSQVTSSFKLPVDSEDKSLPDAMDEEWNIRQSMINDHLSEMRRVRQAYEDKINAYWLEQEQMKKDQKMGGKKIDKKAEEKRMQRILNAPQPPIVDEWTWIDVEDEYVEWEDNLVKQNLENLRQFSKNSVRKEVNLRKFQIVGGVFRLDCFQKPNQLKEVCEQLFIRTNERPKIRHQIFSESYTPITRKSTEKDEEKIRLAKLMKVELQLPDCCCWFDAPLVCRFEMPENDQIDSFKSRIANQIPKNEESNLTINPTMKEPKKIMDVDLSDPPKGLILRNLFVNYVNEKIPLNYKFYNDELKDYETKQRAYRRLLQLQKEGSLMTVPSPEEFLSSWEEPIRPRPLFPVYKRFSDILIIECKKEQNKVITGKLNAIEQSKLISKEKEDVDIGILRPVKNEPILLSELVDKIQEMNENLQPIFPVPILEMAEDEEEIDNETQSLSVDIQHNESTKKSVVFREEIKIEEIPEEKSQPKKKEKPKRKSLIDRAKNGKPLLEKKEVVQESSQKSERSKNVSILDSLITEWKRDTWVEPEDLEDADENLKPSDSIEREPKWSTNHIYNQNYDKSAKVLTFYIGQFGTFGLATPKYYHLPFTYWELRSSSEKNVLLKIQTAKTSLELTITGKGYMFEILEPLKAPIKQTTSPVDLIKLKEILKSLNLNIFPDIDAALFLDDARVKHRSLEIHNYKSMAQFCYSRAFRWCKLNQPAHRRTILMEMWLPSEDDTHYKILMTTPLNARFLEQKEWTVEQLENIPNVSDTDDEFHPDMMTLLKTDESNSDKIINQIDLMTVWHVQNLLLAIQPLSYSK